MGAFVVVSPANAQTTTVTYQKVTDPAVDPQDFSFTASGAGLTNATLDTDPGSGGTPSSHTDTLEAGELSGTKTITETVPFGWTLTNVACTDTDETRQGDSVSFTVQAGDQIVCTFTNVKDSTGPTSRWTRSCAEATRGHLPKGRSRRRWATRSCTSSP